MTNFSNSEKKIVLNHNIKKMKNMLLSGDITSEELVNIHADQIDKFDSKTNAICTFSLDFALDNARKIDKTKDYNKPLSGIPILIKDLNKTAGIRTTMGSRIYKDFIPDEDDLVVKKIKKSGALILGKSNTPEFGAGSHTFNDVFKTTYNPFDLSKTAGGSSGGAGVALAMRMVPIAQGSDMGGSLRNPAAWNNVVGFRTSIGTIPQLPADITYNMMSVNGPMARNVEDLSILLSCMAGYDNRIGNSINESSERFLDLKLPDPKNIKIAFSHNLGIYPVSKDIKEAFGNSIEIFSKLGFEMEESFPNLENVDNIFQTYRAYTFANAHKEHIVKNRDLMKETLIWNVEKGLELKATDLSLAESQRSIVDQNIAEFFEKYDYLVLPSTSVLPFDKNIEYVEEIDGVKLETYIDWMGLCYAITATGCPSISIPGGFIKGLPTGIQIVGKKLDDLNVLRIAKIFEQETNFYKIKPKIINEGE